MIYLAPDCARRARMLPVYFEAVLRQAARRGVLLGARASDGSLAGAAIAMPPGTYPLPVLPQLAEWRTMVASGWRSTIRHFRDIAPIEARRPPTPFWYLMYVGVDPHAQGTGLGAALIGEVVARADGDGVPAYLVTMREANVPYYRRAGFEVRETLTMGRRGPATWTMQRPPAQDSVTPACS